MQIHVFYTTTTTKLEVQGVELQYNTFSSFKTCRQLFCTLFLSFKREDLHAVLEQKCEVDLRFKTVSFFRLSLYDTYGRSLNKLLANVNSLHWVAYFILIGCYVHNS